MRGSYVKFGIVLTINAVMMYFITYAMIADTGHFYNNINRGYMALMMVAPMAVLMLLVMGGMYRNRTANIVLITAFALVFVAAFALARTQTGIGDVQFLRSMIPHHSSAIVMCEQSDLTDAQIIDLCGRIVETQVSEINEMKAILARI